MCELCDAGDPRTPDQQERDRILYAAQFGAVGLLRWLDDTTPMPHTCPACGDDTPAAGYCQACREIADNAFSALLHARGMLPLYDAREMCALRWRDHALFVQRLAAMTDAQLHSQAQAYVEYLHSYSATDIDTAQVVSAWRAMIMGAAATGLLP